MIGIEMLSSTRDMNQANERVLAVGGCIGNDGAECEFIRVVVEVKATEAESCVVVDIFLYVGIFIFGIDTESSERSIDGILPGTVG
jgi:hypothetical protein